VNVPTIKTILTDLDTSVLKQGTAHATNFSLSHPRLMSDKLTSSISSQGLFAIFFKDNRRQRSLRSGAESDPTNSVSFANVPKGKFNWATTDLKIVSLTERD